MNCLENRELSWLRQHGLVCKERRDDGDHLL